MAARASNQLFCREGSVVVHPRCWKFLEYVHNLFTRPLWLLSPAGLRLEITCESDKKKMNLNFNQAKKIFLTEKLSVRVCVKTETVRRKFRETQTTERSESPPLNRLGR